MDQICLVMPVLAGHTDAARDLMHRLDRDRQADYERSEQRSGITKEVWFLASGPQTVSLIAHIEAIDFAQTLDVFSASRDEFDIWFEQRLQAVTGIDLNEVPEMTLPELLSSYSDTPQGRNGPRR